MHRTSSEINTFNKSKRTCDTFPEEDLKNDRKRLSTSKQFINYNAMYDIK